MKGISYKRKRSPVHAFPKAPNLHSSEFEVNNWELSKLVLDKLVPVVGTHPFPLNELLLMAAAMSRLEPKYVFEWGTHIGKSARVFYEISKALGINSYIHSIDLPDSENHIEHPHEQRGIMVKEINKVKLHQGDGVEESLAIIQKLHGPAKKGKGALFFVDGDHKYGSVKRELSAIIRTTPRASILLHDTFYQDDKSKYNVGPYTAIRDVLNTHKGKYKRVDTGIGLPGMTLLYPID